MSEQPTVSLETTLHVRRHCLCLAVQRVARSLARRFDNALRPVGITSGQFSLLMSLNRPEPPTIGDVSATLAMDRTTLTANLKPLERRGLIDIQVDARDRRGRRLKLTSEGHALLLSAMPAWQKTQDEIDEELAAHDAVDIRASLRALE